MSEDLSPYATEQALVAALVAGEEAAARVLLRVYGPRIRDIAMHRFHSDESTARELFQQVFLHLYEDDWRRLRQWHGRGRLGNYLRTIAHRLMLEQLRQRGREVVDPEPEPYPPIDEGEHRPELDVQDRWSLMACLRRALERLSLRDRQLVHRRHRQGQSYREIAEAEGMTVNHVGVALLRAEQRLASWLERLCADLVEALVRRGGET
ncbi:sigma-70 family RNA polymerase sigma factor [Thiohalobacter sp. IOR34]|uniref:RNA polymerase sigma factor n=1 Tax=Thiohalobacter sp. IOR34 TaxID=3057176 RepID=UPI0025AF6E5E|nr:sigma-70 family RNA polymerase sigma factor [Thiohalobacter sp. IOR34]WJW74313.1 sigma-70 family RNA polymerase sigma factor [Thiohalobacter sp. IOR34]